MNGNYNIEIVTPETTWPVTVAELKTHLGITHTSHDTMLADIIAAASNLAEQYTWIVFGSRTLKMNLDYFQNTIIPRWPITAITSITYYDYANVQQTLAATEYDADLKSFPPRIDFDGEPSTYDRLNAVTVNITAGYADVTTIEKGIKQAIKMVCADMYDQRGNIIHGASSISPINYESLFATYRKNYFF